MERELFSLGWDSSSSYDAKPRMTGFSSLRASLNAFGVWRYTTWRSPCEAWSVDGGFDLGAPSMVGSEHRLLSRFNDLQADNTLTM